jgi:hypothetical protein
VYKEFIRPGIASVLMPSLGTVQECKTSEEVTRNKTLTKVGKISRLSTSKA